MKIVSWRDLIAIAPRFALTPVWTRWGLRPCHVFFFEDWVIVRYYHDAYTLIWKYVEPIPPGSFRRGALEISSKLMHFINTTTTSGDVVAILIIVLCFIFVIVKIVLMFYCFPQLNPKRHSAIGTRYSANDTPDYHLIRDACYRLLKCVKEIFTDFPLLFFGVGKQFSIEDQDKYPKHPRKIWEKHSVRLDRMCRRSGGECTGSEGSASNWGSCKFDYGAGMMHLKVIHLKECWCVNGSVLRISLDFSKHVAKVLSSVLFLWGDPVESPNSSCTRKKSAKRRAFDKRWKRRKGMGPCQWRAINNILCTGSRERKNGDIEFRGKRHT